MSAGPSSPETVETAKKPRTSVLVVSAAALALAVTGGVVAGFVWSGGGPAAVAEAPQAPAAQMVQVSAPGPLLSGAATGYLPSLADIVERVAPAVVSIKAKVNATEEEVSDEDLENIPPSLRDFFERFRKNQPNTPRNRTPKGEVQGSGFVIDDAGYIVTNNHVVANATEIEASFADGKKLKAKLIGRDELTDVALLKVDGAKGVTPVQFADDSKIRVGDWVLAVGNPFGLGGTVTAGIISARGRDEVGGTQFTDYLQIDASINRGNSGGPTFDMSGRVVGMNTAIFSPSGGSVGIGFAIPSSTVQRVVSELKRSGAVTRGWFGVQIQSLSDDAAQALGLPNSQGAIVAEVLEGSPALKAGIKQGDVVLKLNGAPIKDNRDLSRKVASLSVGQTAQFTVWRDNRQINIPVTIAKRPGEDRLATNDKKSNQKEALKGEASSDVSALGLGLTALTPSLRSELELETSATGVVITDVDPDSDAAERGLRPGDRIVAVGGNEIRSVSDVKSAISSAKSAKRPSVLLFVVTQRGQKVYVPVKLKG